MALRHENRFGDVYFLQAGKTKTGKPKYYFGKKETGKPVNTIPAGYEIRENPENGQVTLRRSRPTEISPMEERMLSDGVRDCAKLKHFIVDVDSKSLVVYLPDTTEEDAQGVVREIVGQVGNVSAGHRAVEMLITRSHYSPMIRFTLTDPDERLFCVERWCFLGSIDNWFMLTGPSPLPVLIENVVPHLGQESFFELL